MQGFSNFVKRTCHEISWSPASAGFGLRLAEAVIEKHDFMLCMASDSDYITQSHA